MLYASTNHPINCGLASSLFSRSFSKRSGLGAYKIETQELKRVISSSSSSVVTVKDKVIQRSVSSSWVTDYIIRSNIQIDGWFNNVNFTSLSPSVLSKLNNNLFVYESDGECLIQGVSDEGEIVLTKLQTSSGSPNITESFQSWTPNSLADHCITQINSLIESKTQKNVFSVANGTTFIRNSNCWTSNIDLSCASPWNSSGGRLMAGTLISPRHVIFCKHYGFHPSVGATMWFVSQNNIVVTKTIASLNPISSDIVIGTLDSDVPSIIKFAKILPSNYINYLPGFINNTIAYIPILYLNQYDQASVMGLLGLDSHISGLELIPSSENSIFKPAMSIYYNYSTPVIVGDSGNPIFIVINGEVVLLGVFTGPRNGSHIGYLDNKNQINQIMDATTVYQLTEINLSSFPYYS